MTTTTQQIIDVSLLGQKSKEELLEVAQEVGIEDGSALVKLRRE